MSMQRDYFKVEEVDPNSNWCYKVISLLVNEHHVPKEAHRSDKIKTLFYQAKRLNTQTIVIHDGYLCRDYLGDYAALYSKMALPPKQRCVRLLFFNKRFDPQRELFLTLEGIHPDSIDNSDVAIQGLVGTAVIRPTPDCLVGRTVMMNFGDEGFLPCAEYYGCHFYGAKLYVKGVPWLEQAPSVFVCGGAALWFCAFQTEIQFNLTHFCPGELTALARKHWVVGHVSQGMTVVEFATAIKEWGFQPFSAAWEQNKPEQLRQIVDFIHTLIESNIAVIVAYWWAKKDTDHAGDAGHAVTAMGHGLQATLRAGLEKKEPITEIRSTSDWIDYFLVADDNQSPYTPLPIASGTPVKQPLGLHNVSEWVNGGALPCDDKALTALQECKQGAIFAPLPDGIRITPQEVLANARTILMDSQEVLTKNIDKESLTPQIEEKLTACEEFKTRPQAFAIRPCLMELFEYHWDLKSGETMVELDQEIREFCLKISWPIWVWRVQIIRLARYRSDRDEDPVAWEDCKVIGEILIDATDSPQGPFGGIFQIRIGAMVLVYLPETHTFGTKLFDTVKTEYRLIPPSASGRVKIGS